MTDRPADGRMKAWVDDLRSNPDARKALMGAAQAVGIHVCSRHESGVTHLVTQYVNSPKATLAKQSGAKVITFKQFQEEVQRRSEAPKVPVVKHYRPVTLREMTDVTALIGRPAPRPTLAPVQPVAPAPKKIRAGDPSARKLDLD